MERETTFTTFLARHGLVKNDVLTMNAGSLSGPLGVSWPPRWIPHGWNLLQLILQTWETLKGRTCGSEDQFHL